MASANLALLGDASLVPLLGAAEKRDAILSLIESYVAKHIAMDVGIGLAGFFPFPGAAIATTAAAVIAQAPAIYQPMARDIANIYRRRPDKVTGNEVLRGAFGGGLQDVAVELGVEFFKEIASELVRELGFGALLAGIPVVGGGVGIALDATVAYTMTWRVGLMTAIYHENGGKWVKNRKHTYELVRKRIKLQAAGGGKMPTVPELVAQLAEVQQHQEQTVSAVAEMLLSVGVKRSELRDKLLGRGFDAKLVDAALRDL